MKKFGFIVHPLDTYQVCQMMGIWGNLLGKFSPYHLKKILKSLPSFKYLDLGQIKSKTGEVIQGYIIACPLVPHQLVLYKDSISQKRIQQAYDIASSLGCSVLGLGGFTSIVTNGGETIKSNKKLSITTGNTYTACLTIDGIFKLLELMKINPKNKELCIIGATGDIGSICSKYFSDIFGVVNLVGRDSVKLNNFLNTLKEDGINVDNVNCTTDLKKALSTSNFILSTTSALTTIIDPNVLNVGSIVCDVSYPANINIEMASKRNDILVYEGGLCSPLFLSKLSNKIKNHFSLFNVNNTLHGCLAETMLLCFEGVSNNFTFGKGNIEKNSIDQIRQFGIKHGFHNFMYHIENDTLSQSKISQIVNIFSND